MRLSSQVILVGFFAILAQAPAAWAGNLQIAKTRKPPSACVGLDQTACGAKADCYWRKATVLKSGKTRRAHCRIKRSAAKRTPT